MPSARASTLCINDGLDGGSAERNRNTGHMSEPSAFVVPFVLGRDFYVAMIQVLLRQALTRALRAYLSFVTSVLDLETECAFPMPMKCTGSCLMTGSSSLIIRF